MKHPHTNTPATQFINARINEIIHRKTQQEMAREAGFKNSSMITLLKQGSTKLAIDRVPGMAKALEVDPASMMRLTLEQSVGITAAAALIECFGSPVTVNEQGWLDGFAMHLTTVTRDWPDGLGQLCGWTLANERYPFHNPASLGPELGTSD